MSTAYSPPNDEKSKAEGGLNTLLKSNSFPPQHRSVATTPVSLWPRQSSGPVGTHIIKPELFLRSASFLRAKKSHLAHNLRGCSTGLFKTKKGHRLDWCLTAGDQTVALEELCLAWKHNVCHNVFCNVVWLNALAW